MRGASFVRTVLQVLLRLLRPDRRDVLFALVVGALAQLSLLVPMDEGEFTPAWRLTALAGCLPLMWRRSAPLLCAAGFAAALLVETTLSRPSEGLWSLVGALVVSFSLFAGAPLRVAVSGLALVTLALLHADATASGSFGDDADFVAVLLGSAAVAGRSAFRRREQLETQRELADRLAVQQDALASVAVADERARLARDLHDVVAHHVSVIVVQAAAAEALVEDRAQLLSALRAVQQTGRESLQELRRVLDVLHVQDPLPVEGPPGVASLVRLAERARAGGARVSTSVDLQGRELPPGVDLVLYRVLQESITNALRHAPGAALDLAIAVEGAGVRVACRNGPSSRPPLAGGSGRGLRGIADRVQLYGGTCRAGATADGGWLVEATLPLARSASSAAAGVAS